MMQCRYGSVMFFFAGILFLCFRLAGVKGFYLCWLAGVALGGLSLILSLIHACKRLPSSEALTAFLASRLPGGGTVLSALECGASQVSLPPLPSLPKVRFLKWRRDLLLLLLGGVFCWGSLAVPLVNKEPRRDLQKLDLKDEEEQLSQALKAMKKALDPRDPRASQLQKELEEAIRSADPNSPGRTYELLRDLDRRIRQELTRESLRHAELLRQMEALQQAALDLKKSGAKGESSAEFSKLLKALAQKNPALAETLKKGGFNDKALSGAELEKLASALKTDAGSLKRALENMSSYCENPAAKSGSDPAAARKELEEFLKDNLPGCDDLIESLTNRENNGAPGEEMAGGGDSGEPGTGSPGRGRGDAPLEFSGVTPDYGARMVDRKAAPRHRGNEKDSTVVGRFASDGSPDTQRYTTRGGALQTSAASAARQDATIHPDHRKAVRRYFERKKQ